MKQYCPSCGMEMTFYYQNQRWYCHECQKYAEPIQQQVQSQYAQAPQPPTYQPLPQAAYGQGYLNPPAQVTDGRLARSKIMGALNMRKSTDQIISIRWAYGILALQLLVPILTFAMLYLVLVGTNINLSSTGQLILIIAVFLAAVAMVLVMAMLVHKLVNRRDGHFRRDALLKQGMMEYLDALSLRERRDINVERWTMNTMFHSDPEMERNPGLWALLVGLVVIIPIIGIFATLYCLHFLTKDVHEHDARQSHFNHQFQIGMMKLGKLDTVHYDMAPLPRRDTGAYLILSILTLGFFLPYWWYVNIVDMNTHMRNQWQFESNLMKMIGEMEKPPEAENEVPPEP